MNSLLAKLDQIDINCLSPLLIELIELIGVAETLAFAKARGGIMTYIPNRYSPSLLLNNFLKQESIFKLIEVYPGEFLEVPKADQLLTQLRDIEICEERARGTSKTTLALKHNLTRRWIKMITNQRQVKTVEPDLFSDKS